ncbi:hypothetical protein EMIHUDRAFT_223703 [Emiliania huxleyi CCMP1516]|uniref:Uncharacterized protein n=2 Tax=Emiliania huxleyi TaxID=2903 RepID=A0A0D3KTX5_EMIH1|nr:hypothetical protein EMIHUDRAFT_223703 [Emiliania huxleyi CCMP1516]EOD39210.1 hypothetical protein EMIHUDRAFT_223703 [Emiliania huxleyi CCMP1516]|eukprot:XP_005791639.1 hypothetical protein EMIHUDRAFT_223703 [Emiliania huxleyi CCMP1516]
MQKRILDALFISKIPCVSGTGHPDSLLLLLLLLLLAPRSEAALVTATGSHVHGVLSEVPVSKSE